MKIKKRMLIGLAAALVISLSVAGTAFAAGNGRAAGRAGTSATVQNAVQVQNGTPNSTCTTCDQTRLQDRSQARTCDGTGDQQRLRNGSGGGDQQRLRDCSCK